MIKSFSYNKIIVSIFMLMLSYQLAYSQSVTGPTPVNPNSTHYYNFYNGSTVLFPSWVITGGAIISSYDEGGTHYYVEVSWGAAGTGNVAFKSKVRIPMGDLDVTIENSSPPIPPAANTVLSTNENYIHTITPSIGVTSLLGLSNDEKIESVSYFDGLGRSKQNIAIKASPDKKDIITHIGYDDFGRQTKDWLPYYESVGDLGSYRGDISLNTQQYYQTNFTDDFIGISQAIDINAFSEKELEASPLNRLLKQAAPGKGWKLGNGHEIEFDYRTNTSADVKNYRVNLSYVNDIYIPTLLLNGPDPEDEVYKAGELYKNVVYDENYTTGSYQTTEEFKDKFGRILLKRTYADSDINEDGDTSDAGETEAEHDTYYVYDNYGNLTYVLPPKINASTESLYTINTNLNDLAYQYKYDNRNRLVEKKIPGKGWESIVYNLTDQPVLTQDAVLDSQNKWLFTKYDAYGRIAYSGEKDTIKSRVDFQTLADNPATYKQFVKQEPNYTTLDGVKLYYSNDAIPTTMTEITIINYYDNYDFLSSETGISIPVTNIYIIPIITNIKGLASGSKVKVLETNDWITTVTGYDEKNRPIWVYSQNDYLGTTDVVENKLDFLGNVLESTTTHTKSGVDIVIEDKFTYDHMGRLTEQTQAIDGGTKEVIVQNIYDELGQLQSKGVGGDTTQVRLQMIDYAYNVRGWLKQINDVSSLGTDLFAFKINYNDIADVSKRLYNGNISQTLWRTANTDSSLKDYEYTYDALNRISSAIDDTNDQRYSLQSISYDKNGNIQNLVRNGHTDVGVTNFGTMDNLSYYYSGNQLHSVSDSSGKVTGFNDGNSSDAIYDNGNDDYKYDTNGNLIKDLNKGIGTSTTNGITYNHLNLPTEIKFDNNNNKKINYTYDAVGLKLRKVVNDNGVITTTDYASGYVYENNTLQFFPTSEGYVNYSSGIFSYVYQYKDNVGNVRLSYSDTDGNGTVSQSEILKENNYYPFGLLHKGYNSNVSPNGNSTAQAFKYNSKELEKGLNLNLYDLGARQMDPALGRFIQIDPLADITNYQSPYVLADNNPILFVDVYGLQSEKPKWLKKILNFFGRINPFGGKRFHVKPKVGKVKKTRRRRNKKKKPEPTATSTSNTQVVNLGMKINPISGTTAGINPFDSNSGIGNLDINTNFQGQNLPDDIKPLDVRGTLVRPSVLNFGSLNLRQFISGSATIGRDTRLGNDPATQRSLTQIANTLLLDPKVRLRITFQSAEADPNNTGLILTPANTAAVRTWNRLKHQRLALYLYRQFGIDTDRITFSEGGLGGKLIFSKK